LLDFAHSVKSNPGSVDASDYTTDRALLGLSALAAVAAPPLAPPRRALVDSRRWTCGLVSRADVADFLVKQIDDDAFLHKTPVLTS
jgi:hypothetical protein